MRCYSGGAMYLRDGPGRQEVLIAYDFLSWDPLPRTDAIYVRGPFRDGSVVHLFGQEFTLDSSKG